MTVEQIPIEALKTLHTGTLLSRLQALRALEASFEQSDWTQEEADLATDAGLIIFKETTAWRRAFAELKEVLSQREHAPRGSKQKRQEAAVSKKHR